MTQDLRTISVEKFRLEIYRLSFAQLKSLMRGIYEYKRNIAIPADADIIDLERKESIIEKELLRRGSHNPKFKKEEYEDHRKWKRSLIKKRFF